MDTLMSWDEDPWGQVARFRALTSPEKAGYQVSALSRYLKTRGKSSTDGRAVSPIGGVNLSKGLHGRMEGGWLSGYEVRSCCRMSLQVGSDPTILSC